MNSIFKLLKISIITGFIILLSLLIYPLGYYVLDTNKDLKFKDQVNSNANGIVSYIINLDRSKERYEYIKDPVYNLGFDVERISAVDGRQLSQEKISSALDVEAYKFHLGRKPIPNIVGCYLSHVKSWQNLLNSTYEFAIIFEDDVSFDSSTLKQTIEYLTQNTKYWDITGLNIISDVKPLTIKTLPNNQNLSVYLKDALATGAYIINRKAAQELLARALPMKMPVDHYCLRGWEFGLKVTGIENPRLVHQDFGDSDINENRDLANTYRKDKSSFYRAKRRLYKIQSKIANALYGAKMYACSFFFN